MKRFILVLVLLGVVASFGFANDTFYIRNDTGSYIFYYIYVSDARSSEWGDDLLGRDILRPGEIFAVRTLVPIESTTWDIRVIDEDGDTYTIMRRNITAGETIYISLAYLDLD